jgi:hypothetical protein
MVSYWQTTVRCLLVVITSSSSQGEPGQTEGSYRRKNLLPTISSPTTICRGSILALQADPVLRRQYNTIGAGLKVHSGHHGQVLSLRPPGW